MKEWRQAHPKATFREIEQAVAEQMSRLEARLLQETAQASSQRDWRAETEQAPRCPVCDERLLKRGKRLRNLQGRGGKEIQLERSYGMCPVCGTGLFPPG
ncbi:hypothetical protein [Ktedonobacter racemifer]|uniref:Uncharacterized protein n=1 Tax=Ktedonobacter racemifer DSM 44963 TaxID=485913 RepID=D6TU56_KTERA|nr:hypothetical protein [Ktedonobacter racemifer]EFH83957.1 conserved hypothetical protein [Ktedonobacter racemifer DSM 44963]